MVKALVIPGNEKTEVRCSACGKLLFEIYEDSKKDVDSMKTNVIIVARCTRNSCKSDNTFSLLNRTQ